MITMAAMHDLEKRVVGMLWHAPDGKGLTGPRAMRMHVVFFVCHLHVSYNSA